MFFINFYVFLLSFFFFLKVHSAKPTDQICAVERLDYSAFGKDNIGQLISITPDNELEILYFQAKVSF